MPSLSQVEDLLHYWLPSTRWTSIQGATKWYAIDAKLFELEAICKFGTWKGMTLTCEELRCISLKQSNHDIEGASQEGAKDKTPLSNIPIGVFEADDEAVTSMSHVLVLPPWSNLWLVSSIILTMILHMLILYVQPLAMMFSVTPLSWTEWKAVLWLSFPVILVDEVLKFSSRHFRESEGIPVAQITPVNRISIEKMYLKGYVDSLADLCLYTRPCYEADHDAVRRLRYTWDASIEYVALTRIVKLA
eukprot:Gb_17996 [translate_table: standard]